MSLVEKLFGSFSDRELKKVNPITKQVLALEPKYQAMSDADLQAQTAAFKQQLAEGKTLDDILPDAFAVCREAAWRVLGMKHFPVQVTGGIALHRGDIAEMQTGEGKTLVATLPAYLNALTGEGVHIVTVNDYLAKRDSEWMGKLYRWLGLTVGLIVQGMDGDARRAAYNADITYGTNNEFGFDYLRDNMVTYKANMVQRGHAFAIVDEVDSILIDDVLTNNNSTPCCFASLISLRAYSSLIGFGVSLSLDLTSNPSYFPFASFSASKLVEFLNCVESTENPLVLLLFFPKKKS